MTVSSFTSVSIDPPLVAFLPSKTSSSWQALRESGSKFCINMLSAQQEQVGRQIAIKKQDKLDRLEWTESPSGCPVAQVGSVLATRDDDTARRAWRCDLTPQFRGARRTGRPDRARSNRRLGDRRREVRGR